MCDERNRLIEYLYNETDPAERRVFEAHVETCATCRDEVEAFGRVRTDLLAWDVPAHESVWKPFAPARLRPWWRDVPAWAMAAAAAVIFAVGAAGGLTTRALFARQPAAQAVVAAPTAGLPVVSRADLETMRQQIVDTMRNELDSRVRLVAAHTPNPAVTEREIDQLRTLVKSAKQHDDEIFNLEVALNNSLVTVQSDHNTRINQLKLRVERLENLASQMQQQAGGKQ